MKSKKSLKLNQPKMRVSRKSGFFCVSCLFWCFATMTFTRCSSEKTEKKQTLFTEIGPDHSGIVFANNLPFDEEFNIYTYRNFYNGGGVGFGDINNDGLIDVYLNGNLYPNKL